MKRALGHLLNLALLLSGIPTVVIALLDLQLKGRITTESAHFGLGTIYMSLFALAAWHIFVWEHRLEIRRTYLLVIIRAFKAAWICAMPALLMLPDLPPPEVAIPFIIGGALYAVLRHTFAPPHRI